MSEEKKSRPIPEIQSEYQNLCAKAGNLQYQVYTLSKDLEICNQALKDLNIEAAVVYGKQKEAEEKAAAEAASKALNEGVQS